MKIKEIVYLMIYSESVTVYMIWNLNPARASLSLAVTTWTGLGKPVHTCLNMVQTCMYMFTHVHESTNTVYVHVCPLNMNIES